MNRRSLTYTLILAGLCTALLWISAAGMTLTAQGDPTAQQETVNAIVNARFTQTAVVLQERAVTLTVEAAFKNALTATANLEMTVNAQMAAIRRTSAAATLAAGGIMLVTTNDQWTPWEQDFDGVSMVLVPAGCFLMGSDGGGNDEKPIHEVCFEQPFWIDRTEVTQAQFKDFGGKAANVPEFIGENRPVEQITWFEAWDFCSLRGARLPTEAEWEYAARGPESLEFPWGNWIEGENVVYARNSNGETANVGSRLGGASWVGALDMSGNVWEWVNSIYQPYPYNANDGREADTRGRTNVERVRRGGSWSPDQSEQRAANRDPYTMVSRKNPTVLGIDTMRNDLGFRCARSYK